MVQKKLAVKIDQNKALLMKFKSQAELQVLKN